MTVTMTTALEILVLIHVDGPRQQIIEDDVKYRKNSGADVNDDKLIDEWARSLLKECPNTTSASRCSYNEVRCFSFLQAVW